MPNTTILPGDTVLLAKSLYLQPGGSCKEGAYGINANCGGEWPSGNLQAHRSILLNPDRPLI